MTEVATTAHTLRWQGAANRIVRCMLRTPGLNRLAGRKLLTIEVVGRKTGRRFTVPVAYLRTDDGLLIGTPFRWVRNLRTGEPVTIRLRGKQIVADVDVLTTEGEVTAAYARMAQGNRNFATFNGIALGADGTPDPADLRAAWRGGARAVRLVPTT